MYCVLCNTTLCCPWSIEDLVVESLNEVLDCGGGGPGDDDDRGLGAPGAEPLLHAQTAHQGTETENWFIFAQNKNKEEH